MFESVTRIFGEHELRVVAAILTVKAPGYRFLFAKLAENWNSLAHGHQGDVFTFASENEDAFFDLEVLVETFRVFALRIIWDEKYGNTDYLPENLHTTKIGQPILIVEIDQTLKPEEVKDFISRITFMGRVKFEGVLVSSPDINLCVYSINEKVIKLVTKPEAEKFSFEVYAQDGPVGPEGLAIGGWAQTILWNFILGPEEVEKFLHAILSSNN